MELSAFQTRLRRKHSAISRQLSAD